ncbi:MAG: hypothetical protein Q8S18_01755 [Bacteroidales bacterium]|nr:hypothetical protein [Bacteroidales bacterium]
MNVIGIRCTPQIIYYSVINIDEDNFSYLNQELIIPKVFDIPNKLKYVRKTLLDIFREYNIQKAGIRVTENNAQHPDKFRAMLEAVIQELIASSEVSNYITAVISTLSSRLNIPNDGTIKSVIDGIVPFSNIPKWNEIPLEFRESILSGFASSTI